MATKKEVAPLRGAKLMKKAIESAKASGLLASPEPIEPASLARKLKLPNGEPISPAMKELLAFDAAWLGIAYDDEEAEVEGVSLDEIVEEHFGEEAVAAFAEASELLGGDCVLFTTDLERRACLYVGEPDESGEYPVLSMTWQDGVARIGGFVPFDVWAAQELGALERGKDIGEVPEAYAALPQLAADTNGDGRIAFTPKAGDGQADEEDEDDDEDEDGDEDEDEEKEDNDDE
jgi:ribosomal protein L12E/L44/L45/RPP1/RPP2